MKEGIHPEYRPVVFRDAGSNQSFIIRSTVKTR
ncbi:MAG: 50S ribosomal protein L31, partial [Nevskiaceae bacterium]